MAETNFIKNKIYVQPDTLQDYYCIFSWNKRNPLYLHVEEKKLYTGDLKIWDFNRCRLATEEEKIWFEYCEQHGEYRPLEEALDNNLIKQFIQQYLTEK